MVADPTSMAVSLGFKALGKIFGSKGKAKKATPEDFAKFVESIILNPFLNGAVLRMDGGMRM